MFDLATQVTQGQLATAWRANVAALKVPFDEAFWDESAGLYNDNLTTTLHPQNCHHPRRDRFGNKKQRISDREGLQNK